jgi:hypothetical protein
MADYDGCLRVMVNRLALTTAAFLKTSMSAAAGGQGRNLVADNDQVVEQSLEFLARRTYDRVPFGEMTWRQRKPGWYEPKKG